MPNQNTSFIVSLIRLPLKAIWFLIKNPIVAVVIVFLSLLSSISFLAHYNEAIAQRFNSSMGFFLGATLASEASDSLRSKNRRLGDLSSKLEDTETKLKNTKANIDAEISKSNAGLQTELQQHKAIIDEKENLIKKQKTAIARKNHALINSAAALNKGSTALTSAGAAMKQQKNIIIGHNNKIAKFRERGIAIENRASKRFTKVAIYDAAGEFMGWFPIIGDAASIGLAAAGVYEMCQMFKEIESATNELGVEYQVYTDTFCEKPVEKTGEVIAEKVGQIKGKAVAMTTIFQEYTSRVSLPEHSALAEEAQSILDRTYASLKELYE